MPEVTGIDHIYFSVSDLARSEQFYDQVLVTVLGFRKSRFSIDKEDHLQYFNRHFGIVLRPAHVKTTHEPYQAGLHHFCLRVDCADEVHQAAQHLQSLGIDASAAQTYPQYAPDYTATFFADPDGLRLEVTNYREERRRRHDHWEAEI